MRGARFNGKVTVKFGNGEESVEEFEDAGGETTVEIPDLAHITHRGVEEVVFKIDEVKMVDMEPQEGVEEEDNA